jgi:hypothetical protein
MPVVTEEVRDSHGGVTTTTTITNEPVLDAISFVIFVIFLPVIILIGLVVTIVIYSSVMSTGVFVFAMFVAVFAALLPFIVCFLILQGFIHVVDFCCC